MARRLTTNQEIPGSTPGVVISFVPGRDDDLFVRLTAVGKAGMFGHAWAAGLPERKTFCKSLDTALGQRSFTRLRGESCHVYDKPTLRALFPSSSSSSPAAGNWPHGPMARRLTTNQEIPGSTPGVVTSFVAVGEDRFCWR
ncbi:uncharacterized protein K452DRAFT_34950 [Aplosporella prunicola CBS 121167]|uniref:Uncharacterized protein n=1 Tax=Aplosporella prunicola CBS 121167 TaxID=1176127 RepID=A0A6A6BG59_9PEZI|nr:uncharacterized protein K452DRAFT_34950 [Aplosporella prunicola CBS 121167]KAF2141877.1 hypothetical protein K452DRAFT_34950 [Aplosporella prunicola CBS 121167]